MVNPISFTVRPPSAPFRPSPLGNGHRAGPPSRKLFEANNEDEEDENPHRQNGHSRTKEERVDGFSNGRSHGGEKSVEPLVIAAIPNKDWRQSSSRRAPAYRPEVPKREKDDGQPDRVGHEPQKSGLRFLNSEQKENGDGGRVKLERDNEASGSGSGSSLTKGARDGVEMDGGVQVKSEPMTLEEQALAAILAGDVKRETESEKLERELIIDMEGGGGSFTPLSEQDALRRDMQTLPEESTLDDYASIPVSAFGLAMARGMGWDPKASEGTAIHEPKMRPQLLGLGATPMDATVKPTHGKALSSREKEKKKAERATRGRKGFVPTGLMVKKEKEGSGTPGGSRRGSPDGMGSDGSRRKREDGDDSERESKRSIRDSDRGEGSSRKVDARGNGGYSERDRDRNGDKSRDDRDRNGERNRNDDRDRDRWRDREYETEDEGARRKAKEREREKGRYDDRDRSRNGDRDSRDQRARNDGKDRDSARNGDERDRRREDSKYGERR